MKTWSYLILIAWSIHGNTQQAAYNDLTMGKVELVKCPSISDNFQKMLTRVTALKASIKAAGNCDQVKTKLDDVNSIAGTRDQFLALIEKSQTQALTETELRQVKTYAESTTEKIASLIDLITNTNQCFAGDANTQALTSLAGFASEASTLLAQVGGPWGAPIALGGQVVAGFITGLDKILKTRWGYDFSDPAQRQSYIQSVCTYANLRDDIEGLLHPEDRLTKLQQIGIKLDNGMSAILNTCPDCQQLKPLSKYEMESNAQVASVNNAHASRIGSLSVQILSARQWVNTEIQRVQSEQSAYWNDVTGKNELAQAQKEIEKYLLDQQTPKFLMYQLSESNKGFFQFEQFLYRDLQSLFSDARAANLFTDPALNQNDVDLTILYKAFAGTDWRLEYRSLGRDDDELEWRMISGRKVAKEKFEAASWNFGVAYSFCDYYQQGDLYSSQIQAACGSNSFKRLEKQIGSMLPVGILPLWKQNSTALVKSTNWSDALDMWTEQLNSSISTSTTKH